MVLLSSRHSAKKPPPLSSAWTRSEQFAQELEQRKPLTEQVKIPAQGAMRERAQWAQSFPREIGTGNALIKAYKRRYGLTRITALKELQSLGYSFSQQVIERQYRIVEQEKQQLARRKQKKKQRKELNRTPSRGQRKNIKFFRPAAMCCWPLFIP